jgi:hypothetical protein
MIESHLNMVEKVLREQGRIASIAGHPALIGSSREWFIRNFLIDYLPETVKVGQGEIINAWSQPKSKRNQTDVILYRRDFPKITYSQSDNAFLRESVLATIEVKSTIDIGEFRKACNASINHKNRRYVQEADPKRPYQPIGVIEKLRLPSIATYVVSYGGPSNFSTAANWLPKVTGELKTTPENLIDMMIILGKGTIWRLDSFPPLGTQIKSKHPKGTWAFLAQEEKNLLLLFLHLLLQISPIDNAILDYVKNVAFKNVKVLD